MIAVVIVGYDLRYLPSDEIAVLDEHTTTCVSSVKMPTSRL